jgi:putative ABC transport system permease protein
MLGVAAGLVVFVGLLAGSYPALYLAAFRPAQVLGATMQRGGLSASALRRGLIVVQFTIAIVLVVGTGITYQQMNYVQHKRLGFDEEQIVVVPLRDEIDQRTYPALKKRWLQHPGVEHVTASSGVPGRSGIHHFQISFPASQDSLYAPILAVDPDFTETFGVQMTAGRDFSPAYGTDTSSAFVINEAAAERLGWSAPVGERLSLTYKGPSGRFTTKSGKVIGVMENIHYHSLHQEIEPLLLHVVPPSFYSDYLSVRIASGQASDVLAFLGEQWQAFSPERPFEYSFLDAEVDAQYRAERRFSLLVGLFAGLAIAIACLGLFSLAAFAAAQRTKEIGIRKTLGASIPSIVGLLSKEFARLVAVAFVVAAPIAYWAVQQWLDGFAYRIDVGPWMFVGAGVLALSAALLTVSYQAVKAARIDPVNALRYE